MLTRLDLRGATDVAAGLPRPGAEDDEPVAAVRSILDAVRDKGDVAVRELTARFDGVELDDLRVAPEACTAALARLPNDLRAALEHAAGHPCRQRRHQYRGRVDGAATRHVAAGAVDRDGP